MEFELNEKVKCVNAALLAGNDVKPPLIEGEEYQVKEIYTCQCKRKHLDVGLILNFNYVRCYDCHEQLPTTTHWCHSSRFVGIK